MAKKQDNVIEQSKTELSRTEREARIRAMRDKDGVKKPLKKSHKTRNRVLATIALVLIVAVVAVYLLWNFGVLQRNLNAMRINEQDVKITDYNYNFNSNVNMYTQYFGGGGLLDMNDSAESVTGEDITWKAFFDRSARESLAEEMIIYQKALDAGYEITEEDKTEIENYLDSMQLQIGSPLDYELYLQNSYGRGFTEKSFRRILDRQTIAGHYIEDAPDTYEIEASAIDEAYEEDTTVYDLVTYRSFSLVTPTTNEDGTALTDEEIATKKAENEELAKQILENITEEADVLEQAIANASEEDKELYEGEVDITLLNKLPKAVVSGTEAKEWLFDDAREEGDTNYFANGNNFNIVYFIDKEKDTRNTASFMVSTFALTDANGVALSEEEISKIRTEAETLAGQFTSEEDVTAYDEGVAKPSVPKASAGVKYEEVNTGNASSLNRAVVNYALSDEATAGTAGVVDTQDNIYVVTTLERQDTESWYIQIENKLQSEAFSADLDSWKAEPQNQPQEVIPGWWLVD